MRTALCYSRPTTVAVERGHAYPTPTPYPYPSPYPYPCPYPYPYPYPYLYPYPYPDRREDTRVLPPHAA